MPTLAWHFTGNETLCDGSPLPEIGVPLTYEGEIEIGKSGLHASCRLLDAVRYAPGAILHRVSCDHIVDQRPDNLVCRSRTILWSVDSKDILRDFARWAAWQVVDFWHPPSVVRDYLATGDPEIARSAGRAAEVAAMSAWAARAPRGAEAAAWAAEIAARATWAIEGVSRATDAACWAAEWAAEAAARDAEHERQNAQLEMMANQLHEGNYVKWTP